MNEFLVHSAKTAILILLISSCYGEGEFPSGPNHRRAGGANMGLFPFPRVGRSDLSLNNAYADLHEMKRQGLIPFPRVGRSEFGRQPQVTLPAWLLPEHILEFHKRNGGTNMNGGMWFGPRLGRLQKRSYDYNDTPWTFVALKEPSGARQSDYVPRLGRNSEEEDENEDTVVEEMLSTRRMDAKNRNNISQQ